MSNILDAFLNHDLIEGDDERYEKVEAAAQKLSEELLGKPFLLINAIQVGMSPSVDVESSIISNVKECIRTEWKSFSSAYTDEPINLYRGIILRACQLTSVKDNNASILWLTACDTIPFLNLGKEEPAVSRLLEEFAELAERNSLPLDELPKLAKDKPIKLSRDESIKLTTYPSISYDKYLEGVGRASGPNYRNSEGQTVTPEDPNRYWTNQAQHWSHDFSERFSSFLADEIKVITNVAKENEGALVEKINSTCTRISESFEKSLNVQRLSIQKYQSALLDAQAQEKSKLNTLWWSQALYSESHQESYRSFVPELACIMMPCDLLQQIEIPSPASIAYTLSETVNKLPEAKFEQEHQFYEFLNVIRRERFKLNPELVTIFSSKNVIGYLSVFELIVAALMDKDVELETLVSRSLVPSNWKASFPHLSRIIFRQLQAYELADGSCG